MTPRKIPPEPRTRCKAPGAKAGGAFFAPGFFAQAKKGGSRRHGAKAFDLDSAGAGQEKIKSGSLRSRPHPPSGHLLPLAGEGLDIRPAGTFSRMRGRARSQGQQIPRIPASHPPPPPPPPPPTSHPPRSEHQP